ncbi:MAG TPA: ABC transporter substrate-binding protein [Egibacteraceae bacterium]|jgi:peptide/nickel transport system substrate-binding protein|nr:ABC transporter substrate-binding protein [Egibacteraceae bacterium]
MSRGHLRLLGLLLCGALIVAACAPGEDQAVEPDEEAGEATPDPDVAQELVVATGPDEFVDDEINMKRLGMYPLNANICETLVRLTEDFDVEPGLATDWEVAGDNTFRFELRDGVEFHDGTPMDAGAVAYTLNYTGEEPATGTFAFLGPDSAEAVDDLAVEVTPEEPNMRLVEQINHPTFGILAPGSDPLEDQDAVCTGPFRLVEYNENEELVVERNEDYWGDLARLDRITFRFIPDDSTRALALQAGEVDLIQNVERALVPSLEAPDVKIVRAPVGQVLVVYMALRAAEGEPEPVTSDPAVRQAIAHAIDRESFVEGVLGGEGEVVNTINPPEVLGEHSDVVEDVEYDPETAAQVLDQAGWTLGENGVRERDGQPLVVRTIFDPVRITPSMAEYVQEQLSRVGMDAQVEQLESAAYRERIENGRGYDLHIEAPNQNDANPAFLLALRWYSKSRIPNAAFASPGPDTEFDALIDQTQQEEDPDELRRLAAEAMQQLLAVEYAAVPLAGTYRIYAMRDTIEGFVPHPSGINQRWDTVFIGE